MVKGKVSEFDRRVYDACSRIPKGRVSTYGSLAKAIDSCPRAVGGALRRNPFAPAVPCHRVVASDRSLGGFNGVWQAEAPELARKRKLLAAEGVDFDGPRGLVSKGCIFDLRVAQAPAVEAAHQHALPLPAKRAKGAVAASRAVETQRIVGLDWSGAQNAGKLIYMAVGTLARARTPAGDGGRAGAAASCWELSVERVSSAAALSAGGEASGLAGATSAVVDELLRLVEQDAGGAEPAARAAPTTTTVGVDAPLSLPSALVRSALAEVSGTGGADEPGGGGAEWLALCRASTALWSDADALLTWSKAATASAQGDRAPAAGAPADGARPTRELKRLCDVEARAPFAPTNLRLYRQTWSAIALLCLPLLQRAPASLSVLPMMMHGRASSAAPLRLVEACPASLLKRHALRESYKGAGAAQAAARRRVLAHARATGFEVGGCAAVARDTVRVVCSEALAGQLAEQAGGDALDAVLAAVGTACSVLRPDFPAPIEGARDAHRIEGAIYS